MNTQPSKGKPMSRPPWIPAETPSNVAANASVVGASEVKAGAAKLCNRVPRNMCQMHSRSFVKGESYCPDGYSDSEDVLVEARPIIEADVREQVAVEIESSFTDWDSLSENRAPHPLHSTAWFVERAYADSAAIARGGGQ